MRRVRDAADPVRVFRKIGFCGRAALAAVAIGVLGAAAEAQTAGDFDLCNAPTPLISFDSRLPGLVRAVQAGREIRVVAIGSSSTEGTGASTKQASYPARFDREMDQRFPGKDFQVANLGKGGELADAMLVRIMRDVIPARPALVLWQTGVNDAISGVDIEAFRKTLRSGIKALRTAGIELVLVDPQYYPRAAGVPHYEDFVSSMRNIAREEGVPVFRRYAIMRHVIASGQYSVDEFLWKDKFHLNDVSYGCLAELMADAVAAEIRRPSTPLLSAGVVPILPQLAY